jgi:DNA-binding response OmpR family regulator
MSAPDDPTITPQHLRVRSGLAYLDDSVLALRQVRKAAAARGVMLECYERPEELLAREGDPPLTAVLLDVDLGGDLDGPSVAERLRRANRAIAVAFFTAADAPERAITLAALGPVFDKGTDLDAVLRWFDSVRPVG